MCVRFQGVSTGLKCSAEALQSCQEATYLQALPQSQQGGTSVGGCTSARESAIFRAEGTVGGAPFGAAGPSELVGDAGVGEAGRDIGRNVPVGVGEVGHEPGSDAGAGEAERDAGCDEGAGLALRKDAVGGGCFSCGCPGGCEYLPIQRA